MDSEFREIKDLNPRSIPFAQGPIDDLVSPEIIRIVESTWNAKTATTFDSTVIYLLKHNSRWLARAGSYRFFHAAREFVGSRELQEGAFPLAVGCHVNLIVGNWCLLFRSTYAQFGSPGGIMDADDLLDDIFDPRTTAIREAKEETGLDVSRDQLLQETAWFDLKRPHVFFTYEAKIDRAIADGVLLNKTYDSSEFSIGGLFALNGILNSPKWLTRAAWAALTKSQTGESAAE